MNTQRSPMPGTCVSRTVARHDTRPRPHTCEVAKSDCGHWRWSLSLRHSARTTDSKGDEAIGFMSGWGRHRARAVRIFLKQPFTRHTRHSRDAGLSKGSPSLQFIPRFFRQTTTVPHQCTQSCQSTDVCSPSTLMLDIYLVE